MSRCPDCNVEAGQLHIPGCDVERCARCQCQAIGCHCIYTVNGIGDGFGPDEDHPLYYTGPPQYMWDDFDKKYPRKP